VSSYRECDRCKADIPKVGWLAIQSFHLRVDLDLCERCAADLVAWIKSGDPVPDEGHICADTPAANYAIRLDLSGEDVARRLIEALNEAKGRGDWK